ncbi:MAG TPA: sugar transferase [Stellaceae bacterium]|nr:sugar transferase [Stellaceae bacterium]
MSELYPEKTGPLPAERAAGEPSFDAAGKRLLDLAGAGLALLFLGPLLLLIALLLKLEGGSVFFRHRRIGLNGARFDCLKFRTMVPDAEAALQKLLACDARARSEWDCNFKLRSDPRITRLGRFLRKTSLDELPQLINVLRGEMSLVGPRPIVEEEIARYGSAIRLYFSVRPGITGLWQISGRNDVDYRARVTLDASYARDWSLMKDLMIILRTVQVVLAGRGAY